MRRHRLALVLGLSLALGGCETSALIDSIADMNPFGDYKTKLPGERKPVFPEGVPGVSQGVPPELMKGAQQPDPLAGPPPQAEAPQPAPEAQKPKAQPKVQKQARPKQPPPQQQTQQPARPAVAPHEAPWQPPPQEPAPWPQQSQQMPSAWPAPPPPQRVQ